MWLVTRTGEAASTPLVLAQTKHVHWGTWLNGKRNRKTPVVSQRAQEKKDSYLCLGPQIPASGSHFWPRIGELQETLLDMSLKSQDGETLDESEWDSHR